MKVSVVGLGYVGSVAAVGLASAGHDVLGIDINTQKVEAYRSKRVPMYESGLFELINCGRSHGNLRFLTNDELSEPLGDVVIIATGTPPTLTGAADLSQVKASLSWVKEMQPKGCIVMMKSTVPPGTGVRLKESLLYDAHYEYVSNPEFLREGQAVYDWFHPDRIVVGGAGSKSIDVIRELYDGIDAPYVITDVTSAEMIKYAANAFLATKISFINEIATLCDRLGATIDDVSNGIALDSRIGSSFLKAGVGYGGSCFPKDVRALDQVALTNDHNFELLRSVINVNNRQRLLPYYALRERLGRLAGVEVGVLGPAFKPNTDDVREAPSLDLIRLLVEDGAHVRAYDPKAMQTAAKAVPSAVRMSCDLEECVDYAQALVFMTEWPEIVEANWQDIASRMNSPRFLFDGRNALEPSDLESYGFEYMGVGRGGAVRWNIV